MKSSKFFVSTLIAAAAMTATAYAGTWETDSTTGLPVVDDTFTSQTATVGTSGVTLSGNTELTYTTSGDSGSTGVLNVGDYNLVLKAGGELKIGEESEGTGNIWFQTGRWRTEATGDSRNVFESIGNIYVSGGAQLHFSRAQDISGNVFLGASTVDTGVASLNFAAIRVGAWNESTGDKTTNFNGKTTILAEGTKIAFQNSSKLKISNLAGTGNITTSVYDGSNTLNITGSTNFTGTIDVVSGITLNWTDTDGSFGGLSGNGAVGGGSTLNLALADGVTKTFSGTVGSADSTVTLNLSGTGTQGFNGTTTFFGDVSVGSGATLVVDGGALNLSGTATFAGDASLVLTGVATSLVSGLDESTTGLQSVGSTYTIATGDGTVSGLTASNVTINGATVTSVATDCKSATISESVYNIGTDKTSVAYSDILSEDLSAAAYINVAGTLTSNVAVTDKSIHGSGRLELSSAVDVNASLKDSAVWTGTVALASLDTGKTLANYGNENSTLEINSDFSGYWVDQNGGTIKSDLVLNGNITLSDGYDSGTLTVAGDISGTGTFKYTKNNGQDFVFNGAVALSEMNFSSTNSESNKIFNGSVDLDSFTSVAGTVSFKNTTEIGTLNASGTINLTGETSVTTEMVVATGTTLNLNGVHNLTATSVVLEEGAMLTLGNLSNDQNVSLSGLTGNGTISVSKTAGNHDHTVDLGTQFTGTIELKGYFNSTNLTLGSSDGTVKLNGVWFWGGHPTFERAVEFVNTEDVIVGSENTGKNYSSNGMTFNKGATFKEGAKFQISGETVNWGTLTLEANAQLTVTGGDLKAAAWGDSNSGSKTLAVGEGASLSVSGQLSNNAGLSLTNDGTITVGTLYLASGSDSDSISGSGTINATGIVLDNFGTYNVSGNRINVGANGITTGTNSWGYKLLLGDMTLGATADWEMSASVETSLSNTNRIYLNSIANGGTKFDTNGYSISIGASLSDYNSEVGALTKQGEGMLTLSGNNTYSGGTTISAGTLVADNANALGGGNLTVNGTLALSVNEATYSVKNLAGNGAILLDENDGNVLKATLAVNSVVDTTYSGALDDETGNFKSPSVYLNLIKTGASVLTLSGTNSLTSSTIAINEGTLIAASANALGNATVKIAAGAKLQADAAISLTNAKNTMTLAVTDANLASGAELVTGSGTVTLAEDVKLLVDIGGLTSLSSEDSADQVALKLAASNALSVEKTQITLGAWVADVWTDYSGDWYVQNWDTATGTLTLTIPEPSAFGLLAGVGALALVVSRRRRNRR